MRSLPFEDALGRECEAGGGGRVVACLTGSGCTQPGVELADQDDVIVVRALVEGSGPYWAAEIQTCSGFDYSTLDG